MLRLTLRAMVAATLLGVAVIHAAQATSHLAEWWAAGATFVGLAAAQVLLGVAAIVWADRRVWQLAQAVSLAAIGLWVLSRTVGLPVGPEAGEPELVGRADLAATGLEAATVLAATLLLWPGAAVASRRPGRSAVVVVLAIAVLTGAVTWSGMQPTVRRQPRTRRRSDAWHSSSRTTVTRTPTPRGRSCGRSFARPTSGPKPRNGFLVPATPDQTRS